MKKPRRLVVALLVLLPICGVVIWAKARFLGAGAIPIAASYASASPEAKWPWPNAKTRVLTSGVSQTSALAADGTLLDLFEFDFAVNPRLRWEIFDQDEDDAKPFDNKVLYWDRNVARATKELEAQGRGPIWVAWNGAFFGYDLKTPVEDAFHVSPVVLRGKVHFNTAQHRWTFGVKNTPSGPVWKTFFKPDRKTMEREFDFAAGSVQCLIKDGKPLKMEPFPRLAGNLRRNRSHRRLSMPDISRISITCGLAALRLVGRKTTASSTFWPSKNPTTRARRVWLCRSRCAAKSRRAA